MSELKLWDSISQKRSQFEYKQINCKMEVDEFINENPSNWFFRGLNNAKFRIYSSAQREWIGKELINIYQDFDVFIYELINEAKLINNGFVIDILKRFGTNSNELAILSYLQHYGAPTPLIDFTSSRNIAMYFAIDDASYTPSTDINNYVSIYGLQANQGDLTNLRDVIVQGNEQLNRIEADGSVANSEIERNREKLKTYHNAISWGTMICLNDNDAEEDDILIGINSNENIIAQKGLFILNPESEIPLDEQFDGLTLSTWVGEHTSRLFFGKMCCWDIHKSLIPYITEKLKAINITGETVYPNNKMLAKSIYRNSLIK